MSSKYEANIKTATPNVKLVQLKSYQRYPKAAARVFMASRDEFRVRGRKIVAKMVRRCVLADLIHLRSLLVTAKPSWVNLRISSVGFWAAFILLRVVYMTFSNLEGCLPFEDRSIGSMRRSISSEGSLSAG